MISGDGVSPTIFPMAAAAIDGSYDTNVTIDYDFMDYWDVPADETTLNPPGKSSAATQNPNF
jgi:hypothetical protein